MEETWICYSHIRRLQFDSVKLGETNDGEVHVRFGPVLVTGDGLELAGNLEQAAAAIHYALERRAREIHPSMFNRDTFDPDEPVQLLPCEGSAMPAAGAPIPPGAEWVPPSIAAWLDSHDDLDALIADPGIVSSAMFRDRENQANHLEAWDTVSDPKDAA